MTLTWPDMALQRPPSTAVSLACRDTGNMLLLKDSLRNNLFCKVVYPIRWFFTVKEQPPSMNGVIRSQKHVVASSKA